MYTERSSGLGLPIESPGGDSPPPPGLTPAARRRVLQLQRIGVGALTIFIVMSFLYGLNNAILIVVLLTVCTVGIGLLPMALASWLAGWVILAIWEALKGATGHDGPTLSQDASGR